MMKRLIAALCIGISLPSFTTDGSLSLKGSVTISECKKIYFYKVTDEHYKRVDLIDSITVINGKFTYKNTTLPTDLYGFSMQNTQQEYTENLAFTLLDPIASDITISQEKGKIKVDVKGSALAEKYTQFIKGKEIAGNRQFLDSLDNLFAAAREKGNKEEMARIKEFSMPYYEKASPNVSRYKMKAMKENEGTLFGLFLYYSNSFQHSTFHTLTGINTVKDKIAKYDEQSKNSIFYKKIEDTLERFEECAIGHIAPDIIGVDTLGNVISLKDFRGKYVLVDFWSSGCSWCRKETPNLLNAYNTYKDKNFTILGVSSDYRKNDWIKAIHEDNSYWIQILPQKEDMKLIFNKYCIVGIPHIILIDPQGVIVAKDLRGDDIMETVTKFMGQ